eukprot:s1620_g18.t1
MVSERQQSGQVDASKGPDASRGYDVQATTADKSQPNAVSARRKRSPCHACHTKETAASQAATADKSQPSAVRAASATRDGHGRQEPTQCRKGQACQTNATPMSPSATPAIQSDRGRLQAPCVPHKRPRHRPTKLEVAQRHVTAARSKDELGCRSYRRGSWEAAQSRNSTNKRLLREEVVERRGASAKRSLSVEVAPQRK